MSDLPFVKGHALGNDYIIIDESDLDGGFSPGLARLLCDRHRGIGADGVLLARVGASPPELRIINPDGTEAEKSGNGLRIYAAYLHRQRVVAGGPFRVRLPGETVELEIEAEHPDGSVEVRAEMGRARFAAADVGYAERTGAVLDVPLDLGNGLSARIHAVSMGNPHCVVFVEELERDDFEARAPRLAAHPAFRSGTNVQFVRVAGAARLEAWIWERGAGETLASGSSACAIVAAATRCGLIEAPRVDVDMPGGRVEIEVDRELRLRLRGPAVVVYEGAVRGTVLEAAG